MRFVLLASLGLGALFARANTGSPAYVGCIQKADYVSEDDQGSLGSPQVPAQTSCAAECVISFPTALYSYWNAQAGECSCTSTSPVSKDYDVSTDVDAHTCSSDAWSVYLLSTTFTFEGCYSSFSDPSYSANMKAARQMTPAACLDACDKNTVALLRPMEHQPKFGCLCGDKSLVGKDQAACGPSDYFIYQHTPKASATGWSRRKLKDRVALSRSVGLCPTGLDACSVPGSLDYECLDTRSELESCGGCANGYHGSADVSSGVDCTALPGVPVGGVTCSVGRCEIMACDEGWTLVNGVCKAA